MKHWFNHHLTNGVIGAACWFYNAITFYFGWFTASIDPNRLNDWARLILTIVSIAAGMVTLMIGIRNWWKGAKNER